MVSSHDAMRVSSCHRNAVPGNVTSASTDMAAMTNRDDKVMTSDQETKVLVPKRQHPPKSGSVSEEGRAQTPTGDRLPGRAP